MGIDIFDSGYIRYDECTPEYVRNLAVREGEIIVISEVKEKIDADRVANEKLMDAIRLVQETAFDAESGLDHELVGLLDALKTVCTAAKYRVIQDAWNDNFSCNYDSWICCNCGEDLSALFDVSYCPYCGQHLIFKK